MTCIDGIWGHDKMHRWPNHHPLPEINQGGGQLLLLPITPKPLLMMHLIKMHDSSSILTHSFPPKSSADDCSHLKQNIGPQ